MPTTATITASDLTTFAAQTVIQSAKMNTNFSIWRGHNLPVDPTASAAAATKTWDVGSADYRWRNVYGSPVLPVASTTAAYALLPTDHVFAASPAAGTITVTLPALSSVPAGKIYVIKKTDATVNEIVIDGSGVETIDGTTSVGLFSPYESMTVISNGSAWYSI